MKLKIDRMRRRKTPWGGLYPNNPTKVKSGGYRKVLV
ncbi:hypothetical protein T08_8608 [Trichinella sp. T8]|nr:hypothetical protein T08_8608 [Trichinella sp. T8]